MNKKKILALVVVLALAVIFRQNRILQLLVGAISFMWERIAPLSFLLLAFYNGKRGRRIKYAFYAFYPAHLLILYIIARSMGCQY